MSFRRLFIIAAISLASGQGVKVQAAGHVYLFLSSIPGSCTESSHLNWINCSAVSLYYSTLDYSFDGFTFDPIKVEKLLDRATPLLMQHASSSADIDTMILDVCAPGETAPFTFRMVCSNSTVAVVEHPSVGGTNTKENVALRANLVRWYHSVGGGSTVETYTHDSINRSGHIDDDTDGDGHLDITDDDDDNDGMFDWEEFVAGTDPTDPDSRFVLNFVNNTAQGDEIKWVSVENKLYTIWVSTNAQAGFRFLTSGVIGTGPTTSYLNTNDLGRTRCYQVRVEY